MIETLNGSLSPEPEARTVEISLGTVFTLKKDVEQKGLILDPRTTGDYFGYAVFQLDERLRKFWVGEIENGRGKDIAGIVTQLSLEEILAAGKIGEEKYGNPISPKLLVEIRSRAKLSPRVLTIR